MSIFFSFLTNQIFRKIKYSKHYILFFYIILMAMLYPIEYDESWSFVYSISSSFFDIFSYKACVYANNHIINSAWIKINHHIFMDNLFTMRLISMLSFLGFIYFLKKFFKHLQLKNISFFILVICFPVHEYFYLARGYALALFGLSGSLYFLYVFIETKKNFFSVLSLFFSLLASLAILSFTYYLIALICVFVFFKLKSTKSFRDLVLNFLFEFFILLIFLLYLFPVAELISKDPYIIGTDNLIVSGTFASILTYITGQHFYPFYILFPLKVLFTSFFLFLGICILYLIIQKKFIVYKRFFYSLCVISFLFFTIMIALHYIKGTKYPLGRGLIYFIPIIFILITITFANINNQLIKRIILIFLSLFIVNSFLISYNRVKILFYDNPKDMLVLINKDLQKEIMLYTDTNESSVDYYKHVLSFQFIQINKYTNLESYENFVKHHYFYLSEERLSNIPISYKNQIIKVSNYKELGKILFVNKNYKSML